MTIYFRKLTIEEAERIQDKFNVVLGVLEDYHAKAPRSKEHKKNLLIYAKKFYDGREMIVNAFKNGIFLLVPGDYILMMIGVYNQIVLLLVLVLLISLISLLSLILLLMTLIKIYW